MTNQEIINYRLINQQIVGTKFKKPEQIVKWFGAMQSQDFAMAKWAIGLRLPGHVESEIEKSFNEGRILRTHVLRPTWHFATPEDIGWMVKLTAPRVNAFNSSMYRKMGLDDKIFRKSNRILEKALEGKNYLTRDKLKSILEKKKLSGDGVWLACIMMKAELDGLICSGPKEGKQFTYALLDERVRNAKSYTKTEALAELTKRYFTSRGPATAKDFTWWSGLSSKDVKDGIGTLGNGFKREVTGGKEFIFKPLSLDGKLNLALQPESTLLLPDYDEYGISYKDRTALFSTKIKLPKGLRNSAAYFHMIVIDGMIGGTWQRTNKIKADQLKISYFVKPDNSRQKKIDMAIRRYLDFSGK